MMKKICTFGAICALLLSACGKVSSAVLTSGGGTSKVMEQLPENTYADNVNAEKLESQMITVTSREVVKVVPDMAEIVYSVQTQDKDAAACQNTNSEKVNQLIEQLKGLGIEETSIQTSGYDMSPRYDWDNNGKIVGYEVTTQVTVSNVHLDQVGSVLTKSVESGVNQVQSVAFLSSSYDESYHEALKLAVAQAQEKAQALADASGCTLGRPVRITEYNEEQSARYVNSMRSMKLESAAADMAVMPGEIDVEARITVDFAIQ